MDYIPPRYDQVDLSTPKKPATTGNKVVETVDAILDLPATIGFGLLFAAWGLWKTKVPRLVKFLLAAVLATIGTFLILLTLLA